MDIYKQYEIAEPKLKELRSILGTNDIVKGINELIKKNEELIAKADSYRIWLKNRTEELKKNIPKEYL